MSAAKRDPLSRGDLHLLLKLIFALSLRSVHKVLFYPALSCALISLVTQIPRGSGRKCWISALGDRQLLSFSQHTPLKLDNRLLMLVPNLMVQWIMLYLVCDKLPRLYSHCPMAKCFVSSIAHSKLSVVF